MSGQSGNQLVLFCLESSCFPRLRLWKHQDSRENKTNCFPRGLTLSVYHHSKGSLLRFIYCRFFAQEKLTYLCNN